MWGQQCRKALTRYELGDHIVKVKQSSAVKDHPRLKVLHSKRKEVAISLMKHDLTFKQRIQQLPGACSIVILQWDTPVVRSVCALVHSAAQRLGIGHVQCLTPPLQIHTNFSVIVGIIVTNE